MSIELYKILAALFYIGATAVFVDAWANKNRLDQAITITNSKAFIGCPKAFVLKFMSKKIMQIPLNFVSGIEKFETSKIKEVEKVKKNDVALITFTTGSTGMPKAAKRTHEYLLEQHYVLKKHLNPSIDDVDLTSLPIFVLHNLACGTTSVIPDFNPQKPADINPKKIIKDIEDNKITTSVGSPRFYEKLAEYGKLNGLKKVFLGGAPVFPKLAKKLEKSFVNTKIEIVYGSTEAEPISSITTSELIDLCGNINNGLLVGIPSSDIKIKIIKPIDTPIEENEFENLWLNTNEVGEICVEGKHVLKEYFNSDEAQKFSKIQYKCEVWHRTGDGGFLDENGNLYLMGRVKNRFIHNDKEIYVFPIENALLEIYGIEIGTILKRNEKVYIVLETYKNADKDTIEKDIKGKGILFDEIIFLNKIPRDPRHNSKIDYDKLNLLLNTFIPRN